MRTSPRRSFGRQRTARVVGLLALLALGGCGGGGAAEPTPTPAPPAPFRVVATSPAQGAVDVATEELVVHFELSHVAVSTSVIPGTVLATVGGADAPVVVTLQPNGRSIDVRVGGALPPSAEVEVLLVPVMRASDGAMLEIAGLNPLRFTLSSAEQSTAGGTPGDPGRFLPAAATLADGRLLVVGGLGQDGGVRADAELGAADGTAWTATAGAMDQARWGHVAGALPDGRAVVAGGFTTAAGDVATNASELFDPATGAFVPGPSLAVPRGGAAMLRTTDALLVVVGGSLGHGGSAATAALEAYDPARNVFVTLSTGLPVATTDACVAPLPGGLFLVAGGLDGAGAVLGTAHVFEPEDTTTRTTLPAGPVVPRHGAAAVLAPTGDVYLFGGRDATGARLASIERFDPVLRTFTLLAAGLSQARDHAQAVVLANGTIAIVGGIPGAAGATSARVDVFDPTTEARLSTHVMAAPFAGGAVFPLPDGGLLVHSGATTAAAPLANRLTRTVLSPGALGSAIAAPRVVSFLPAPSDAGVDPDADVFVKFSKVVEPATVPGAIVVTDAEGKGIEGTTTLLADRVTVRFDPTYPLPLLQRLTVEVKTSVTDRLGTPLADDGSRFGSFTTGYDLVIGAKDDGSQFGYAVATGDVNGDGVADLAVSAYVAEPTPGTGPKPGQVYVVFGRTSWGPSGAPAVHDLAAGAAVADLTITFETDGDQPGIESALQVGDLDGDGYADVMVGAHNADGPAETNSNKGEVFVVFGQASFPAPHLQLGKAPVAGFDVLRIYGAATGDRFGEGMAVGDVDADGFLDLVVGSRFVATTGATGVGAVYVVFGGTKSTLGVVSGYGSDFVGPSATTLANVRFLGTDASDNLGWSAGCADFDGDGYADVLCGSTGGDGPTNAAASSGEVITVFGAARSTLIPSGLFASHRAGPAMGLAAFAVYGDDAGDFFAWAIGTGDLDEDGYADLAVGALLADGLGNFGSNRGEAAVLFGGPRANFLPGGATWAGYDLGGGVNGNRLLRLHGEADGHSFGDCFAIADVDADGKADLLVGDYQARGPLDAVGANVGEVSVLRGAGLLPASGTLEFALSTVGAGHPADVALTRFYGKTRVVRFGTSLAVADLNADGLADVITGANQARGLGHLFTNGGEAYVLWGRPTWWR
jgi:hypothetical protein